MVQVYQLGATTYGIIHDIRTPQPHPQPNPTPPKMPGHSSKCANKVTCRRYGSHGHKTSIKAGTGHGRGKASQTISESRQENYGITVANVKPRSV